MANAEENYKQRLVELLGTTQDPFAKVASDEAQLDLVTQTFYEGLGDTAEASEAEVQVPEILTPLKDLHKVASIADFSDRDILESAPFQAGFRSVMEKYANEFEEALEKVAITLGEAAAKAAPGSKKVTQSYVGKYLRGKAGQKVGHGAAIGAGLGAVANAYGTHRANQYKAPEDRKSVVGGALAGGALGGVAGGAVAHGDTLLKVRNTRLARKSALDLAAKNPLKGTAKKRRAKAQKVANNDTWAYKAGNALGGLKGALSPSNIKASYNSGVTSGGGSPSMPSMKDLVKQK